MKDYWRAKNRSATNPETQILWKDLWVAIIMIKISDDMKHTSKLYQDDNKLY